MADMRELAPTKRCVHTVDGRDLAPLSNHGKPVFVGIGVSRER